MFILKGHIIDIIGLLSVYYWTPEASSIEHSSHS